MDFEAFWVSCPAVIRPTLEFSRSHTRARARSGSHTQLSLSLTRCYAKVAHVFVSLANLVLLSRGKNILAEDFKYYSPGTGRLDRDR